MFAKLFPKKSAGGGCFNGDAPVLVPGHTFTAVKDLAPGDKILAFHNAANSLQLDTIVETFVSVAPRLIIVNRRFRATEEQPILCQNGWKPVGKLQVGDVLLTVHGREEVTRLNATHAQQVVYTLEVKKFKTFVVDHYIAHNKLLA